MKKKLYNWHKQLGILVCIPLMLWSLSGITHPLMNWFKPDITTNQPYLNNISTQDLMPVHEILESEGIKIIERIRLVDLENKTTYQVRIPNDPTLKYWDALTGAPIHNGDEIYAQQLARYFLGDQEAGIIDIELIESFNTQYRSINRLLPVYKVSFERHDDIQIYVETGSSRLGTAVDRYRHINQTIFWLFHNFGFLDFSGWFRSFFLLLLSLASVMSAIFGIVVFGFTNPNQNSAI